MNTARKYQYTESNLRVVKGGKQSNNKKLLLLLLAFTIISAIFIVNSLEGNTENSVKNAIDWNNPPCSPSELSSDWEEITHPDKKLKTENREFKKKETNEIIEFHPKNARAEDKPHWHRRNPFSKEKLKYYLDKDENVVRKNSKQSHIYTNC